MDELWSWCISKIQIAGAYSVSFHICCFHSIGNACRKKAPPFYSRTFTNLQIRSFPFWYRAYKYASAFIPVAQFYFNIYHYHFLCQCSHYIILVRKFQQQRDKPQSCCCCMRQFRKCKSNGVAITKKVIRLFFFSLSLNLSLDSCCNFIICEWNRWTNAIYFFFLFQKLSIPS